MVHKNVLFIAAVIGSFMLFPQAALASDLPDIRGHWGEGYITALMEKGAIDGMSDGKFYPDEKITLPQFIKIIISLNYGHPETLDGEHWASGYMRKAVEKDIIYPEELEFYDELTRYSAVRILNKTLTQVYNEPAVEFNTIEDEVIYLELFEDIQTNCYVCGYEPPEGLTQTYAKGIISGRPGQSGPIFDGDANLSRAEACVLIMRMIDPKLRTPPEGMN